MANAPSGKLLSINRCYLKTCATLALINHPPSTTSTAATATTSSSSLTVQYLTNSCGLSSKSALSVSKKLHINESNLQKAESVLGFLKSSGFKDTHIAKLIEKKPAVLRCRVDCNMKPKFQFLIENGFVGQHLPELVVSNPMVFRRALGSQIIPSFELLKSFLGTNENVVAALKRASWLLTIDLKVQMQPNFDFLMKEGVPFHSVTRMLLKCPRMATQKHDRVVYAVNAVKNLGLQPNSSMFMLALKVKLSMTESNLKKKMEVMKSLGWSDEEVLWALKTYPFCFACSEEKIRHAVDFYENTMKLERQTILSYPQFLLYSIDKRIRPRHNVLKVLESRKLIKGIKNVAWLLTRNEKHFFKNYVKKYLDQVPDLLDIYGVPTKQKS